MNNTYLRFGLPIALLTAFSAFADEPVKETPPVQQNDDHKYRRVSLAFDMFWGQGSFSTHHAMYRVDNTFLGTYRIHGKETERYEGLRYTSESLKPNAFYSGTDLWFAVGNAQQKVYLDDKKVRNTKSSTNLWLNLDVGLGYNFQPSYSPHFLLSVFAGPGVHYERKYHRDAKWGYGMIGFKIAQDLTQLFSLGLDFKTMYSYNVWDRYGVTGFERKYEKHFWGIELGAPFTWHIGETRKFDLQFKPYLLKFNLNSEETILGSRVALGYTY